MIFLSHTKSDKPVVYEIAKKISAVFGKENIFYDEWSIKPGDGIIDKMNDGLEKCQYFFFFVSKQSLQSEMVKNEWQNAMFLKKRSKITLVPVKLDECMMPAILLQTKYIDIFGYGMECAIRQIIETISGNDIPQNEKIFHNIRAYITEKTKSSIKIEFRAEHFMEPQSRYLILIGNNEDSITFTALSHGMISRGFIQDFQFNNGLKANAVLLGRESPTSLGFPFVAVIKTKNESMLDFKGVMRAISATQYKSVPII